MSESPVGEGRAKFLALAVLGVALVIVAIAVRDAWRDVGHSGPGFGVMESRLVAIGGFERAGLEPFDRILAIAGRPISSGAEVRAAARRLPPGTPILYTVATPGGVVDVRIPTALVRPRDFKRYLVEGALPALLVILLGAGVIYLRPCAAESRLFLGLCAVLFMTSVAYRDSLTTHRFDRLFLAAWALTPAVFLHLALTFPERRSIARRWPGIVWLVYAAILPVALVMQLRESPYLLWFAGVGCFDWGLALVLLILSLVRTGRRGSTALVRQRARVLAAGFVVSFLLPVLGTATEGVFRISVPYLSGLWRLSLLFPLAVGYAIVRYSLFDIRAVIRVGTIYSVVTGLVVAAYAGAITLLNLSFSMLDMSVSPVVPAAVVSLAVVLFVNPVYVRLQRLIDRLFFRQRYDAQQAVEGLADALTSVLELPRVVGLIARTIDGLFHPRTLAVLLSHEARPGFLALDGGDRAAWVGDDSALARCFASQRLPLTRERLTEDPELAVVRDSCRRAMEELRAAIVIPVFFRDRLTALLVLGDKRSGAAYTSEDQRLLRMVVNQSAVALENAKAYTALQAALRRVEILESIRASLSKFVSKTVQDIIERAPEAPALAKQEVDVSVLFVDIAGYTRLSERLDAEQVNRLVERYFGAFLDEILAGGGDVNETAGDGLMVIFQHDDPRRHAQAAARTALAILRRASEINDSSAGAEAPIQLHVGVNSGRAAVGATKIEGTAGTRWTYTASGPVTNVAARLAALGEDAVLLGPETRRRLDDDLAVEDLGEHTLRNVEEPLSVYRLRPAGPGMSSVGVFRRMEVPAISEEAE